MPANNKSKKKKDKINKENLLNPKIILEPDQDPSQAINTSNNQQFKAGQEIYVFLLETRSDENERHVCQVATLDHRGANFRPRIGLSEGWVAARVMEDFPNLENNGSSENDQDETQTANTSKDKSGNIIREFDPNDESTWVQIEYLWPFWVSPRGHIASQKEGELCDSVPPHHCILRSDVEKGYNTNNIVKESNGNGNSSSSNINSTSFHPALSSGLFNQNQFPKIPMRYGFERYYSSAYQKANYNTTAITKPLPPLVRPDVEPELGILCFRWGGADLPNSDPGELMSITNQYLYRFMDYGLRPLLGKKYEIWSCFIEDWSDCKKLSDSMHMIFPECSTAMVGTNGNSNNSLTTTPHQWLTGHPIRRCKRVVSMFFLNPTSFDTFSQPALMTGEDGGAGNIQVPYLFDLMRSCERAGIVTRFPHSAHLYQLLTEKAWTHMLCQNPLMRIPASICVPRMFIERDLHSCAEKALRMLSMVKKKQIQMGCCGDPSLNSSNKSVFINQGVSKLCYSWEALDVKMWKEKEIGVKPGPIGAAKKNNNSSTSSSNYDSTKDNNPAKSKYRLVDALEELTRSINITDHFVGQTHIADHVLVQEFVPHTFEMRLYYIENVCKFEIFTKFWRLKPNQEFGDFTHLNFEQVLTSKHMGLNGDRQSLHKAVEMGKETSNHLIDWLRTQTCENIIPAVRMDFFVRYEAPGTVNIHSANSNGAGSGALNGTSNPENSNTGPGSIIITTAADVGGNLSTVFDMHPNRANSNTIYEPLGKTKGSLSGPISSVCGNGSSEYHISANTNSSESVTEGNNVSTNNENQAESFNPPSRTNPNPFNCAANEWVNPNNGARITINTLEICEVGFSTLQNKDIPKAVMPALVRSCFSMDGW